MFSLQMCLRVPLESINKIHSSTNTDIIIVSLHQGLLGTSGGDKSTLVSNRKPSSMFDAKSIKPGQDKHSTNNAKLAAISSDGNSQVRSICQ